jgi:LacI family transcriptional regulator
MLSAPYRRVSFCLVRRIFGVCECCRDTWGLCRAKGLIAPSFAKPKHWTGAMRANFAGVTQSAAFEREDVNKRAGAPPTITDVARKAGVSIKTVSRVMNKEPTVHADTRARVQEAVAELNYRPQLSARSLAGAKSFLIGLLYYDPSAAFVAGFQQGATLGCREAGRHLVVESLHETGDDVLPQLESMLAALRPDGMILTPPLCDDPLILETLRVNRTPCVLISPAEGGHGMPRVLMDDALAAEELTDLLISLGHRRIGFIEGDQSASDRRRHGYERALKVHGIRPDAALVVPGSFDFDAGVAGAQKLFALASPPTAIFAANDDMALGALTAAQRLGIAVPHDVAIVGFDDSRAASLVWPALTTVRQPLAEMAMAAVDMLLSGALQPGATGPVPVRVLAHEVIVRGSTAAPVKGRQGHRTHYDEP